ncbi:DUF1905 domain-containing protein [Luteococcus sanguinis]|uniref:DUF1905 domain-containing protein n=1 Tax=Luteococcus sanguinis TaxID=174038 RepID=A0ABW1WZ09_9ACTN
MEVSFAGTVIEWRGPAPYHFVRLPEDVADVLADVAKAVTYGWGMVPVDLTIGDTTSYTALWPKDGSYLLPLKDALRRAEGIELSDEIEVHLSVRGL